MQNSPFISNVAAASRLMRKDDSIEVVFVSDKLKVKTRQDSIDIIQEGRVQMRMPVVSVSYQYY
jgi:hypothetical protein